MIEQHVQGRTRYNQAIGQLKPQKSGCSITAPSKILFLVQLYRAAIIQCPAVDVQKTVARWKTPLSMWSIPIMSPCQNLGAFVAATWRSFSPRCDNLVTEMVEKGTQIVGLLKNAVLNALALFGWWFGICFISPYIGNVVTCRNHNWLSYFSEG